MVRIKLRKEAHFFATRIIATDTAVLPGVTIHLIALPVIWDSDALNPLCDHRSYTILFIGMLFNETSPGVKEIGLQFERGFYWMMDF